MKSHKCSNYSKKIEFSFFFFSKWTLVAKLSSYVKNNFVMRTFTTVRKNLRTMGKYINVCNTARKGAANQFWL